MIHFAHIDFELRNATSIKLGSTRYAMSPTAKVLCLAWAVNDDPVKLSHDYTEFDPRTVIQTLERRDVFFVAHNAGFERAICEHVLKVHIPADRFVCTAAMARHFGLAGGLGEAARTLGLPQQKAISSKLKKLWSPKPANNWCMNHGGSIWFEPKERFVIPAGLSKPHQRKFEKEREKENELFEELYSYCMQDVETERALFRALPPLPIRERRLWVLDSKINQRGIPVDRELAVIGDRLSQEYVASQIKDLPRLTGGAVNTPKQVQPLRAWLAGQGVHLENLQAQTVCDALDGDLPDAARTVLEIRAATAGNAQSKFAKFAEQCGPDHRVRDSFIYYGSHTGRWTSEGTQTNNIVRPEVKDAEVFADDFKAAHDADAFIYGLSPDLIERFEAWQESRIKDGKPSDVDAFYRCVHNALVRATIAAPPGRVLIAEDYAAIEARGAMWLAGQQDVLESFARGEDLYIRTAAPIFAIPESSIEKGSFQRLLGKKIFLGGQYGIGPDKFLVSCMRDGVKIEQDLAEKSVKAYRARYSKIPALWKEIDNAVRYVFTTGKPIWVQNKVLFAREVHCGVVFMSILLPSGRKLYYPRAEYKETMRTCKEYVDGKWTGEYVDMLRWSFSYWGRIQNKQYGCVHTWGGGLTENIVQAFCRDLLCGAMLQIEKFADIIMHVYDEIVVEVNENEAEEVMQRVETIMRAGAPWSQGMPIDCEGWIGKRYRK